MVSIHPEYVVDKDKHLKSGLLPVSEWEQLMNELDDIRAYDIAKASFQDSIPFDQAVREIQEGSERI